MWDFFRSKALGLHPEIDPTSERFVKSLIALAVAEGAQRIVLGEPCESDCQRIRWEPTTAPYPPWEDEQIACLTGSDEHAVAQERGASAQEYVDSRSRRRLLPIWFKKGDTYREMTPLPAHLFFPMLRVFDAWNRGRISHGGTEGAHADASLNPPPEPPGVGVLSNFLLTLDDNSTVHASVGFEKSYCLSIFIHGIERST